MSLHLELSEEEDEDDSPLISSEDEASDSPLISSQDEGADGTCPTVNLPLMPSPRRPRGRPRKSIGSEKSIPKIARDNNRTSFPNYTPMSTSNDDNSDSPLISSQDEEGGMAAPPTSRVPRPRGRPRKSPLPEKPSPVNVRITRKSARSDSSTISSQEEEVDESGISMNSLITPPALRRHGRSQKPVETGKSIPKIARDNNGAASPKYTPMSTSNDDASDSPLISSQEDEDGDPPAKRPRGRPRSVSSPPRKSSKLTPYSLARKFRDGIVSQVSDLKSDLGPDCGQIFDRVFRHHQTCSDFELNS